MPKIDSFNKQNLKQLRKDLAVALATVEKKHGLAPSTLGGITFDPTNFRVKLEMNTAGQSVVADQKLDLVIKIAGLKAKGNGYKIVGHKPRAWKRPFVFEATKANHTFGLKKGGTYVGSANDLKAIG